MALRRTAAHRADLVARLRDLDRNDRRVLAESGYNNQGSNESEMGSGESKGQSGSFRE